MWDCSGRDASAHHPRVGPALIDEPPMNFLRFRNWLSLGLVAVLVCACSRSPGSSRSAASPAAPKPVTTTLRLLSGSENKDLEPILREFTAQTGTEVKMAYEGSVDIMLQLQEGAGEQDGVWPANSLWVELSGNKNVKHAASIMRSPVVFGIKKSAVERLGLKVGEPLPVRKVLDYAKARKLEFLMTNPTQSNSGAMAYLGFLHALSGREEAMQSTDLDRPDLQGDIRLILSRIDRTSASSAWLKDLYLANTDMYDAMVNYESVIIDANLALESAHKEPLIVFYPAEGQAIADSPLAYLDHGDTSKEKAFLELQQFLLTPAVQARLGTLGRRAGLVGTEVTSPSFRTEWGVDPHRILQPFPLPNAETIWRAISSYQKTFKKPSLTAFVLDFSGSMKGQGERQLYTAMRLLLEEQQARHYLLSTGEKDVTIVVPFDAKPRQVLEATGDGADDLGRLLNGVLDQHAGGGTDIYAAAEEALARIAKIENLEDYHASVILMTDGKSEGSFSVFSREWEKLKIPVFTIMFADADPTQLEKIARQTKARMFDGRKNLIGAFREAKGYN